MYSVYFVFVRPGAAAASALHQSINQSALAVPKTAAVATAVLRPSTPVTMQMPFCTSVTTISTTAPGVLQSIHPQIGQRVVMAPVRSVTPPLNRSTSPTVSIPGGAIQHHADIQHRSVSVILGSDVIWPFENIGLCY